jgi:signal transduction histidine kinase
MLGSRKYKGLRLSTKLILTYSFVALIAVVASGAVALPLLQSYQDSRTDEERQRVILEYTDKLDSVRSTLSNRTSNLNPFRDYLVTNPNAAANAKTWPETPPFDTVWQKFRDLAQARDIRLIVLINGGGEVAIDTEPDANLSLQGDKLTDSRYTRPTQQPGAIRQPPWDGTITLANGQEYGLLFREISGDNAPNLFGLTNRGKPLPFIIATIKPSVVAPEAWRDLAPILAIAAVPALLVSFILGLFLARSMSRPLVRLTNATQAVARGEYQHRVSPEGGYELTHLAESFNQMTHAVDESQRMQRQLIANVSHELKTPLTSIQGFSQAMLDGALRRPEDFARPAEIISQEAARMVRLVNGLLDLSRLESGQITLQLVEMDLAEMLRYCIESFTPSAEFRQVALVSDFRSPLMLRADADRLRQVFNNLIDNALKYTPAGGVIKVSAFRNGKYIQASVADSGSGISGEDLPHIFERFYQADKARRRDQADIGTGLGLAISKEIVVAHGGKIDAASAEGQGTQFNITLPALVNNITQIPLYSGSKNNPDIEVVNKK